LRTWLRSSRDTACNAAVQRGIRGFAAEMPDAASLLRSILYSQPRWFNRRALEFILAGFPTTNNRIHLIGSHHLIPENKNLAGYSAKN
jgi:hypothetical protein